MKLLLIGLLTLALASCGQDETLSADEANRIAGELAEQTQTLSEDVAEAARTLVDDPAQAREDLEALREQLSSETP